MAIARVQANGVEFGYVESGSGPLVLALHGFPDLPRTFRHQMEALSGAGFRVVAPYMRGYHPTLPPPDASYERAELAQDALALIDTLSEEPVVLLGHDWGAAAAYHAACVAPEKIARLVTIAVPYGDTWWGAFVTILDPPGDRPDLDPIREAYGRPIPVPSLYIHGEHDGGIGAENLAGMEAWFPAGLELHVVPDAGHFVHRERPHEVNRLIMEFLDR